MKPLTTEQITRIHERSIGTEQSYGVAALIGEIDRVSGMLADCWLLMDAIARGQSQTCRGAPGTDVKDVAEALLRKQQAPGWKV